MISYHNPYPVAFPWEPHVPVPGWGFTPNLAGPATLAVGDDVGKVSFDIPFEPTMTPVHGVGQDILTPITTQQAQAAWSAIAPQVAALLEDQRKKLAMTFIIVGGAVAITAVLATAWLKKGA